MELRLEVTGLLTGDGRSALDKGGFEHHRFLLRLHLQQIDAIGDIDQVEPFRITVELLSTIPGVDQLSACVIPGLRRGQALAEIGRDMSRSRTAGDQISWAGLCPRNNESAGKRHSHRSCAPAHS